MPLLGSAGILPAFFLPTSASPHSPRHAPLDPNLCGSRFQPRQTVITKVKGGSPLKPSGERIAILSEANDPSLKPRLDPPYANLLNTGTLKIQLAISPSPRIQPLILPNRATTMKAAWYEKQGPARDVLIVGDMPDPIPAPGEVRIRISASGINPGDTKKREDWAGFGMSYPRVIPHSDGAGKIDKLGDGVPQEWLGREVWCWGAQSYRAFGTAAEFTTLPLDHVAPLPKNVSPDQGACLGIPGITAHRAVHVAGSVNGLTVLVQGAAGGVGSCAVALARLAGARVIGTVRSPNDEAIAAKAGAHEVVLSNKELVPQVKSLAPAGIDHIVEVAFAANIDADLELLKTGGSISTYATNDANAKLPFWQLCFKNARLYFLGSDDFPIDAKLQATKDINRAFESGWPGFEIAERLPLSEIARAHDLVDHPQRSGRIVLTI